MLLSVKAFQNNFYDIISCMHALVSIVGKWSLLPPTSYSGGVVVWRARPLYGLVTALHTTSSDGMQLADMVAELRLRNLPKCKDGVNNN